MTRELFEKANFGDRFVTRCGKEALFLRLTENSEWKFADFYVKDWGLIRVNRENGKCLNGPDMENDIVGMMPFLPSGLDEAAEQGVKLKCWIARDECSGDESNLYIGQKKPRRIPETAPGFGMWCDYGEFMALPPEMFPELTYSDEPIEVELIIRKK